MGTVNKVVLIGRLGRDPDHRLTGGGTQVSNFSVATDQTRNTNGTPQKFTEWHRVVAFGKMAETCNQYLRKGRLVCVEGALQTRSWEKSGEKHYSTEIVASRVTFLDKNGASPGEADEPADEST